MKVPELLLFVTFVKISSFFITATCSMEDRVKNNLMIIARYYFCVRNTCVILFMNFHSNNSQRMRIFSDKISGEWSSDPRPHPPLLSAVNYNIVLLNIYLQSGNQIEGHCNMIGYHLFKVIPTSHCFLLP